MILFVGNLSRQTTEQELRVLFSPFGVIIKARIMMDKITRWSRGYAYVHMSDPQAAGNAVKELNSTSFMDSFIIVGPANIKQLHSIDWS